MLIRHLWPACVLVCLEHEGQIYHVSCNHLHRIMSRVENSNSKVLCLSSHVKLCGKGGVSLLAYRLSDFPYSIRMNWTTALYGFS